ncbi:MAG: peptide chain release factor N(5)-glutamine methyltransferase, partial [Rhodospirillaceae bacterium]
GQLFSRSREIVDQSVAADLETLVQRRMNREPVSRILGRREFWGLEFELAADTLDPRADTETLVSAVLGLMPQVESCTPRILDMGTGTGCILLASLHDWPEATGLGSDISEGAVAAASRNAARLGLTSRAAFEIANWADGLTGPFDIIVSNPPYISEPEQSTLSPEVLRFDPPVALFGGADGLDAYRNLLPSARRVIAPQGRLILEVGASQREAVAGLLSPAGFAFVAEHRDLGGVARCVVAEPR